VSGFLVQDLVPWQQWPLLQECQQLWLLLLLQESWQLRLLLCCWL
jgi:hypothetical protein